MEPINLEASPPLNYELKNARPIELHDLTKSLESFADEFRRYVNVTEPEASASDVTLYVKEIRAGSILATLVAASPQIIQNVGYINAVVGFVKHLKGAYDWLSGKSEDKPPLDKASLENLANIVEPVAKDHAAQVNINNPTGPIFVRLNSMEANAVQNAARREIERLAEPATGVQKNVLLYFYQARDDRASKTGDKGIIEQITTRPVRLAWANDSLKMRVMHGTANPFEHAFLVDVMVQTIQGKPKVYVVLELHDTYPRDED